MKFPEHKCGLYLEHNAYRDVYITASEWCNSEHSGGLYDWPDAHSKQRAIDTDEIWTLQWYPNTPIGCFAVAAPTLPELLEFANTKGNKDK